MKVEIQGHWADREGVNQYHRLQRYSTQRLHSLLKKILYTKTAQSTKKILDTKTAQSLIVIAY